MPKFTEIEGCLIADRAKCYREKFKKVQAVKKSTIIDRLDTVLKSKRWIEDNLSKKFSINRLAKDMGMAESQLQRIFKQSEGISIVDHLQKRRMAKATELFKDADLTVTEVAFQVGMSSSTTFSNLYKRIRGHSPKSKKSRIE